MYIAIIKLQTTQVSHHAVLQNEKICIPHQTTTVNWFKTI